MRIIIECPENRFSTKRPDTFTQTISSPNFKALAVWRRTIHYQQLRSISFFPKSKFALPSRLHASLC